MTSVRGSLWELSRVPGSGHQSPTAWAADPPLLGYGPPKGERLGRSQVSKNAMPHYGVYFLIYGCVCVCVRAFQVLNV